MVSCLQVLLLSLAAFLASSSILDDDGPVGVNTSFYVNMRGTQVIEIGPGQECQIHTGDTAQWLQDVRREQMTELNYIQFRLMVGKCQLQSLLNPTPNTYAFNPEPTNDTEDNYYPNFTQDLATIDPLNSNTSPVEEENEHGMLPLIFPGTKWCGAGTVARDSRELGFYENTDRCCREHDNCPDSMPTKMCKNNLCNDSDFTRSHCDCDEQFRQCLQNDRSFSSLASFKIANLYFNILRPLCYAKRHPVKWCKKTRITGECVEFEYDYNHPALWQFFFAQPYIMTGVDNIIQPIPALNLHSHLSPSFARPFEETLPEEDNKREQE